ncbi:hypothetical protein L226DRAFT_539995 [Lentinus tigrinus ALCF2SS1-7]|uniref:Uncharacterized protein n=1 Tax=Lentinus tigrinus ALCF2SS1-6 TaxID=1328759 RepID=A0A5C2RRT8_9APHY|nr:hypothetical protein L227DRAFT_356567 [Lentinus tigrinus ALCF2SS1-6]RPD69150.1 hypothetical protein L226DRAFT_539995 [Lentinus tigrinus ALCF2SS1-7]
MSHSTEPMPVARQVVRGPRDPPPRLASTALPDGGLRCRKKRGIPMEKFHDVLLDPEAYAEMYPDVLPLTRRIHRQLRALRASGSCCGWTGTGPTLATPPGYQEHERGQRELQTTSQEPFVSRDATPHLDEQCTERQPRSFLDMTDDIVMTGPSQESGSHDSMYCTPAQDNRACNVLDLVERGEWEAVPQVSASWMEDAGKSGHYDGGGDVYLHARGEAVGFCGLLARA